MFKKNIFSLIVNSVLLSIVSTSAQANFENIKNNPSYSSSSHSDRNQNNNSLPFGNLVNRFYFGLQLGLGIVNTDDKSVNERIVEQFDDRIQTRIQNKSFSGRVYAGYQITSNLGVEAGYAKYGNAHTDTSGIIGAQTILVKSKNRVSVIDALGVLTLPFNNYASIHFKAGAAYVLNRYETILATTNEDFDGLKNNFKSQNIRPKFGIGLAYQLKDNIALGIDYEVTTGHRMPSNLIDESDNNKFSPELHLLSINLNYRA